MTANYQVAVLGGGPAGCSTALALRRRGVLDVLLVEAGNYDAVRIGESIPPESRLLMEALGIWQDFLAEGHEPCLGSCSVWGDDAPGYNDFLFNPHGNGWHLDRRRFDAFLARKAVEGGVELWSQTRYDGVEPLGDDGFALQLTADGEPRTVTARFVVDGTGSRSLLARPLNAVRRVHDRLSYVATFLEAPASAVLSRLTLLEAVDIGWWYAALLPDRRVAVAVASDPEIVRNAELHRKDVWLARLAETRLISRELAGCQPGCQPESADMVLRTAWSSLLDPVCGRGWLAVGDAASSYDPISSQGIHKAMLDGLQAAEAIAAWLAGEPRALDEYRAAIAGRFDDYLGMRNYFYERERRWPSAPFWMRRRARVTLPAAPPRHLSSY